MGFFDYTESEKEGKAIEQIGYALDQLKYDAQQRVMRWACEKYYRKGNDNRTPDQKAVDAIERIKSCR